MIIDENIFRHSVRLKIKKIIKDRTNNWVNLWMAETIANDILPYIVPDFTFEELAHNYNELDSILQDIDHPNIEIVRGLVSQFYLEANQTLLQKLRIIGEAKKQGIELTLELSTHEDLYYPFEEVENLKRKHELEILLLHRELKEAKFTIQWLKRKSIFSRMYRKIFRRD